MMKGYVIEAREMYYTHSTGDQKGINFYGSPDAMNAAIYFDLANASRVLAQLSVTFPQLELSLAEVEL